MNASSRPYRLVHLEQYEPVAADVLASLAVEVVRRQLVVPIAKEDGRLLVAMPMTEGIASPDGLEKEAGCPVEIVFAPMEEILTFIRSHYSAVESAREEKPEPPPEDAPVAPESPAADGPIISVVPRLFPTPAEPPVSDDGETTSFDRPAPDRLPPTPLMRLLMTAIDKHADEVVVDGDPAVRPRVRFRVKGTLVAELKSPLTTLDMDAVIGYARQGGTASSFDGARFADTRFTFHHRDQRYAVDLAFSEAHSFALTTLRLRPLIEPIYAPEQWGMGPQQARMMNHLLERESGLVLFVGMQGESVGYTLRSAARRLATPDRHVVAVDGAGMEWFPGVERFAATDAPTFASLLDRAFRHRPDAVIVDGISGPEIARRCFDEAASGRLILARLESAETADAMVRLLSFGLEPHLLGSALLGIVAERSLRLLCTACRERDTVSRERVREIGIPVAMQPASFFRAKGCEACGESGYEKEARIFEVLEMSDELRSRLSRDVRADALRSFLRAAGAMTFRQSAIHRAISGQTSLADVLRTTP